MDLTSESEKSVKEKRVDGTESQKLLNAMKREGERYLLKMEREEREIVEVELLLVARCFGNVFLELGTC